MLIVFTWQTLGSASLDVLWAQTDAGECSKFANKIFEIQKGLEGLDNSK